MEALLPIIASIIGLAVGYWILTSARFRKEMGRNLTDTIGQHSKGMVEQAQFSRAKAKLDAIQDLTDDGHDKETVTQQIADFDDMFCTPSPSAQAKG